MLYHTQIQGMKIPIKSVPGNDINVGILKLSNLLIYRIIGILEITEFRNNQHFRIIRTLE